MNTLFNAIVVTTLLTLLFLLNILVFLNPSIFRLVYPLLTEDDTSGWSTQTQTQQATNIAQMLIHEEPFQKEQLLKLDIEMTESEISHMNDVGKLLVMTKVSVAFVAGIFIATLTKAYKAKKISRTFIRNVLKKAIIVYLLITVLSFIGIFLLWSSLFTTFHELLFTPGTWTFPTDSTLIRLFPEIFWQKTFTLLIVLPIIESALLYLLTLFPSNSLKSDKITS